MVRFQDYQIDGMDVVMLTKQWVHSASLSQSPLMVFPKGYAARLEGCHLVTHDRRKLSNREMEEQLARAGQFETMTWGKSCCSCYVRYLRTAKVVEADPWYLGRAADYLRAFVDPCQILISWTRGSEVAGIHS